MARQTINIGAVADDGTGDSIRVSGVKINENFAEVYTQQQLVNLTHFEFDNNTIKGLLSNADIEMSGNGTGHVDISDLTIDSEINLSDNEIKTNTSNTNLQFTANGTGSVEIANADINGGVIDGTVIGGATSVAGTFTTLTVNTQGLLVFQGHSSLYDNSFIEDATATVLGNTSSAQVIDTWSLSTHRSVKYHIQISDATANRFSLIEANVTHNGSSAFISVFGGVDNGTGDGSTAYDSLDLSADVSSGNVRLLGTVNNTNNQVIKLVRRTIKV